MSKFLRRLKCIDSLGYNDDSRSCSSVGSSDPTPSSEDYADPQEKATEQKPKSFFDRVEIEMGKLKNAKR
jgi:hypothetical protein